MGGGYDDARFGVIERKWFGLSKKHGGDVPNARVASGIGCFGTTDATSKTHIARWYPRGPISLVKAGSFVLATITNASNDLIPARITVRGASASAGCSWNVKSTSTAVAPRTFASTTTFTARNVKAGEYLSIKTGTPRTDNGTAANTATTTGTVAFFIDYVRKFDQDGKWDLPRNV